MSIHPTDQHPFKPQGYCPRCDYRVNVGDCPECGTTVKSDTIRPKPRGPFRARWLRRAGIWVLVAGTLGVLYQFSGFERRLSTSTLLRIQQAADPRLTATELARRFRAGEMSEAQEQQLYDAVFQWHWTLRKDGVLQCRTNWLTNAQVALRLAAYKGIPFLEWNGNAVEQVTRREFGVSSVFDSDTPRFVLRSMSIKQPNGRTHNIPNINKFYLLGVADRHWQFVVSTNCSIIDFAFGGIVSNDERTYVVEGEVESEAACMLNPEDMTTIEDYFESRSGVINIQGPSPKLPVHEDVYRKPSFPPDLIGDDWEPTTTPRQ